MCSNCPTSEATSYCKDCEELICKECTNAHYRVKITQDHVFTDEIQQHVTTSSMKCTNCVGDEIAAAWCRDCSAFLCLLCVRAHEQLKITQRHLMFKVQEIPAMKINRINCAEALACAWCVDCSAFICKTCQKTHTQIKTTSKHVFIAKNILGAQLEKNLQRYSESIEKENP